MIALMELVSLGVTALVAARDIARYCEGIAAHDDPTPKVKRVPQLLLKAVRGLPPDEQDMVLALLVERALGAEPERPPTELAGAMERPDVAAGASPPRPWLTSPPLAPGVLRALGSVASRMLLGDKGVAEVAALCAITEEEVRDALRDASLAKETPESLRSYLGLLAEGRSAAQARRKLKLSRRELEALREDPATTELELRLGRLVLTTSQYGAETRRALMTHMPMSPGWPTAMPAAMATPAAHDLVHRLLLGGQDVEQIAKSCGIRVDAVRAALHQIAAHPDATEPLASILRMIADGRSREQAAAELGISQEEFSAALGPLSSSPLQQKLTHAFSAAAVARPLIGTLGGSERAEIVGSGALGAGAQQVVPVRFPEVQYQRLKDWCATHGFSMAVVLRGLVERFLDDQERRAA